ncbi:MAG: PilX N-terminal domain-containing pilus assembly protein [Steroidobacteraceae bacterium]
MIPLIQARAGSRAPRHRQSGITLAISLILLTLVTLLIVTAMFLSTANIRSVSNLQFRDQAVVAANAAIEQRVEANFNDETSATSYSIDVDADGTNDIDVEITTECLRATKSDFAPPSSVTLPVRLSQTPTWHVTYDIDAVATDAATGAQVEVRSGVRVLMSDSRRKVACPDTAP